MGKFKQTLLTEEAYSELSEFKQIIEQITGRRSSFTEVIKQTAGKQLTLLKMDQDIKNYIMRFVDLIDENPHTLGVILYGSITKNSFSKFSDIDLAIITDSKFIEYQEYLNLKRREVNSYQDILIKRGLSLFISPLILTPADLEVLNPLYFEIADYGIVLFQRGSTVSEFLDKIAKIKHKRKNTKSGEMLVWE
ncbi:MAG: DNA polymerase beta protein [Thermoplasmatales archaeon E-plasma]|jgi:predicted nucleotidyltransferase|nr:MAG: DNA polymerase beta protein [Thermoplasmatales archaeon E-plasma]